MSLFKSIGLRGHLLIPVVLSLSILLTSFGDGIDLSADFLEMAKSYSNLRNKSFAIEMEIQLDDGQKSKYSGNVEIGVNESYTDFMNTIRIISDEGYLMVDRANNRIYYNEKSPDISTSVNEDFAELQKTISDFANDKIILIESTDKSKKVKVTQPRESEFSEVIMEYDIVSFLILSIDYKYKNPEDGGVERVSINYGISDISETGKQDKWKRNTYIKKKSGSWVAQEAFNRFKVIDLTSKK